MRTELQRRPRDPRRKEELLKRTWRLGVEYGYEVLAGTSRITRGDHPVHDRGVQLHDAASGSS